jgi:hypothetical protein
VSSYLTRVELHGATYDDYEHLHKAMKAKGFTATERFTAFRQPNTTSQQRRAASKSALVRSRRLNRPVATTRLSLYATTARGGAVSRPRRQHDNEKQTLLAGTRRSLPRREWPYSSKEREHSGWYATEDLWPRFCGRGFRLGDAPSTAHGNGPTVAYEIPKDIRVNFQ